MFPQIVLALHNYESANGSFPMGFCWQWYNDGNGYTDAAGELVRLTQFIEQSAIYNAMNFSIPIYYSANTTVCGAGAERPLVPQRRPRSSTFATRSQHLHILGRTTAAPCP